MLKKLVSFLNDPMEKPYFVDSELSSWAELEADVWEDEPEEKCKLL